MIEELIYNHLLSHIEEVGDRIYPMIAKDGETTPYITYFIVDEADQLSKSKSRTLSHIDYRMQIDVYDSTALGAKELKKKIKESLYSLPNRPTSVHTREKYEPKIDLFAGMIDFKYRYKEGDEDEC